MIPRFLVVVVALACTSPPDDGPPRPETDATDGGHTAVPTDPTAHSGSSPALHTGHTAAHTADPGRFRELVTPGCPVAFEPVPVDLAGCESVSEEDWGYGLTTRRTFDAQGRLVFESATDEYDGLIRTFEYDAVTGDLLRERSLEENGDVTQEDHTWTRDGQGRVVREDIAGVSVPSGGAPTPYAHYKEFVWGPCGVVQVTGDATSWVTTEYFVEGTRVRTDFFGDGTVEAEQERYVHPATGVPLGSLYNYGSSEIVHQTHDPATGWLVHQVWETPQTTLETDWTYDAEGRELLELKVETSSRHSASGGERRAETTWTCPP